MFSRRRRGESARRSTEDAPTTESHELKKTFGDAEFLASSNQNENAKKEKAPTNNKADKGGQDKNAKSNAKLNAKNQSKASLSARKPSNEPAAASKPTPAAAPPPPPPPAQAAPSAVSIAPTPSQPNESELSLAQQSQVTLRQSDASQASGVHFGQGHDPAMIHKILTKIHFPAMHPMFLAENVAPAVLPTQLLTDHEMVTIFIDCLSRSPNKFGLFPADKRSITPLLSVRPIRSTERPFTIEFNPRDRIHRELKQRILLVSGLPPDRYMLKSEDVDVNRLLQEAPEGTTIGDIGLKEGDKLDLVQTIRVKVVGPLAEDYRAAEQGGGGGGGGGGCSAGCSGAKERPRNTIGTLDVMETERMRDLKPKVQRVLEDQGLSVDGLVFKSHGDDVRDSAAFIECRLDAQGYETARSRPLRNTGSGASGQQPSPPPQGCVSGCTGKPPPPQTLPPLPSQQQRDDDEGEFCGMSNCDEKRCRGMCRKSSGGERNYR